MQKLLHVEGQLLQLEDGDLLHIEDQKALAKNLPYELKSTFEFIWPKLAGDLQIMLCLTPYIPRLGSLVAEEIGRVMSIGDLITRAIAAEKREKEQHAPEP